MTAPTAYTLGYNDGRTAERDAAVSFVRGIAAAQPDQSDSRDLLLMLAASLAGCDHHGIVS